MVKKKSPKKKRVLISTREGKLRGFVKISPGKFAFVFMKNGKTIIGKSRFKTKTTIKEKFARMVRKKKTKKRGKKK